MSQHNIKVCAGPRSLYDIVVGIKALSEERVVLENILRHFKSHRNQACP